MKHFVFHITFNEPFLLAIFQSLKYFICQIPVTEKCCLSHSEEEFIQFKIHNFVFIACDILQNNKEGASYPHRKVNVKVMPGSQIFLHASQLGFFSEWIFWLRHSNWMFGWRTLHHLSRCRVFGNPWLLLQIHGYLSPLTVVFGSWWSICNCKKTTSLP